MAYLLRKVCCQKVVPISIRPISAARIITGGGSVICPMENNNNNNNMIVMTNQRNFSALTDSFLDFCKHTKNILSISTIRDVLIIANFYTKFHEVKYFDFLAWHEKSDRLLKPAVLLPQPPADFPFKIHDNPDEETIRLTRELPREKLIIDASFKIDVNPSIFDSSSEEAMYFRNFLPKCYSDFKNFRALKVALRLRKMESNVDVDDIACDHTQIQLDFFGNSVEFSKCMDSASRKYWGEIFPLIGFDEALLKFVVSYMVRRIRLNRLHGLNNVLADKSMKHHI